MSGNMPEFQSMLGCVERAGYLTYPCLDRWTKIHARELARRNETAET